MNLFFHWSVFCAHLGVACVPVQRLVVQPHAFSHARLLHKKNNVVSRCARVYLKTHDVTGSEGFLRCARHFFAGILTYFKEK